MSLTTFSCNDSFLWVLAAGFFRPTDLEGKKRKVLLPFSPPPPLGYSIPPFLSVFSTTLFLPVPSCLCLPVTNITHKKPLTIEMC